MNKAKLFLSKIKKGFTLAEVLITLGIIGVVAAMTIPTLVNNAKHRQLESSFKKAYSALSQAISDLAAKEGGSAWANYNYTDNVGRSGYVYTSSFKDALMSSFVVAKDCGANGCVPNATYYRNLTNTNDYMNTGNFVQGQFYLADGMLIMPMLNITLNTILIHVDTNGYQKGPNRAGYDLFVFQLMPGDKLVPVGQLQTTYLSVSYCVSGSTITFNGIGCAFNALTDKDYFSDLP